MEADINEANINLIVKSLIGTGRGQSGAFHNNRKRQYGAFHNIRKRQSGAFHYIIEGNRLKP